MVENEIERTLGLLAIHYDFKTVDILDLIEIVSCFSCFVPIRSP